MVRAAPTKEFQVLVLESVGGKELLELLAGAGGKIADILQIKYDVAIVTR
jgi:hypothetical protein